jgi:hypothetical protein
MSTETPKDKQIIVTIDGVSSTVSAREKKFKTGSIGYYVFGKVSVNGKKHQLCGNLIEIGSKQKSEITP